MIFSLICRATDCRIFAASPWRCRTCLNFLSDMFYVTFCLLFSSRHGSLLSPPWHFFYYTRGATLSTWWVISEPLIRIKVVSLLDQSIVFWHIETILFIRVNLIQLILLDHNMLGVGLHYWCVCIEKFNYYTVDWGGGSVIFFYSPKWVIFD